MLKVRIVPDAEPNAESILHEIDEIESRNALPRSWREMEELLRPFIPDGWHVVALADPRDTV